MIEHVLRISRFEFSTTVLEFKKWPLFIIYYLIKTQPFIRFRFVVFFYHFQIFFTIMASWFFQFHVYLFKRYCSFWSKSNRLKVFIEFNLRESIDYLSIPFTNATFIFASGSHIQIIASTLQSMRNYLISVVIHSSKLTTYFIPTQFQTIIGTISHEIIDARLRARIEVTAYKD